MKECDEIYVKRQIKPCIQMDNNNRVNKQEEIAREVY
jgi:hypothetical protein